MLEFLSEGSLALHMEYVRRLRLKYSILEKSVKEIKSKNLYDILRQKIKITDKTDALNLISEIVLHDVFFSSFRDEECMASQEARRHFGSESALLYSLYRQGMKLRFGFVCVYCREDKIWTRSSENMIDLVVPTEPTLAVDVCEHSYFCDFGFDKERYLLSALSHLDLSRLEKK